MKKIIYDITFWEIQGLLIIEVDMIALYLSLIDEDLQKNKFEKMYYRYRNLMYHIAFQVVNNERDAEDAVQEGFIRIAKNMDKIGDVLSTETKNFVAIITKREAMKIYDKRKKRNEIFETELSDEKNGNYKSVEAAKTIKKSAKLTRKKVTMRMGKTLKLKLKNAKNKKIKVEMMHNTEKVYYENEYATGFEKYYGKKQGIFIYCYTS